MPPKAAYKEFEAHPDLELEFMLADRLGMTVARLRDEMTTDEFLRWSVYHARRGQRAELARKAAR
jgi:hypothetical protein